MEKDEKFFFDAETNDFDQQISCGHPFTGRNTQQTVTNIQNTKVCKGWPGVG